MGSQPGDLLLELFALQAGRNQPDPQAGAEMTSNRSFDPTELIDIGDDAIADAAALNAQQGKTARRHVERPTGIVLAIPEVVPAGKTQVDANVHASFVKVDIEHAPWRGGAHLGLALTIAPIDRLWRPIANYALLRFEILSNIVENDFQSAPRTFAARPKSEDISLTISNRANSARRFAGDIAGIFGLVLLGDNKTMATVGGSGEHHHGDTQQERGEGRRIGQIRLRTPRTQRADHPSALGLRD
jgi:hypothetical protein